MTRCDSKQPCKGKSALSELVRSPLNAAEEKIISDNTNMTDIQDVLDKIPLRSICCNRVFLLMDVHGLVKETPKVG